MVLKNVNLQFLVIMLLQCLCVCVCVCVSSSLSSSLDSGSVSLVVCSGIEVLLSVHTWGQPCSCFRSVSE